MKKQLGITLILAALATTPALAGETVIGALIGGGAGAAIGHSIGGRNAAIIGGALGAATGAAIANNNSYDTRVVHSRPGYYAPPPPPAYYAPEPVVYPQQVYYPAPVRVERRVYYVENDYQGGHYERRHPRHDRDWRRDDYRDWNDRY